MATYAELLAIASGSTGDTFRNKVRVAVVVAADVVRAEAEATPNHANRMAWAREALNTPDDVARRMVWAVLAQNRAVAQASILAADDATVQTAVNAAIDLLSGV